MTKDAMNINRHQHAKKMSLDTDLISFTEISLKQIIGLHAKYKIIKLLENNILRDLDGYGFDNDVLDTTPKAWSMKKKLSWTSLKLKRSVLQKTLLRG